MTGSKNPRINNCIIKANEEAFFYYAMNDLEELLDQYGAEFVLKNCQIDNSKLFTLYKALQTRFVTEISE